MDFNVVKNRIKYHFFFFFFKGLHRGYSEDAVEADEVLAPSSSPQTKGKMRQVPPRPPRKGSLSRPEDVAQMNGTLEPGEVLIFKFKILHYSITLFYLIVIHVKYLLAMILFPVVRRILLNIPNFL